MMIEYSFKLPNPDGGPIKYMVDAAYYPEDKEVYIEAVYDIESKKPIESWEKMIDPGYVMRIATHFGEEEFKKSKESMDPDLDDGLNWMDIELAKPVYEPEPEEDEEEGEDNRDSDILHKVHGDEEDEEEFEESMTSVQRRKVIREDIALSSGDEQMLSRAWEIEADVEDQRREPTPDEALMIWRAKKLSRGINSARRKLSAIRRDVRRPSSLISTTSKQLDDHSDPTFALSPSPLQPSPTQEPEPIQSSPTLRFAGTLDAALDEQGGDILAAANAGPAAAKAATSTTAAPAHAADSVVKPLEDFLKSLTSSAATIKKMNPRATVDNWLPRDVRDRFKGINFDEIFKSAK
jgi:hypothetical protein